MIVWISGPTGAGKTSLARILRSMGYALVKERLPRERFRAFARDPSDHCRQLQEDIIRSRFRGWQNAATASHLVFDRSIDEDIGVFCRMHRQVGFLTDREYGQLERLASELQSTMPQPDLIVYLCPAKAILAKRVTESTYPALIVQNLDLQLSFYANWLETRREEILKVDNSGCSLRGVERLLMKDESC